MNLRFALTVGGVGRLRARLAARHHDFDRVHAFVVFVGHPRSGHTLVSALLDAHPDAVIANELHVLRRVRLGYGRSALFGAVVERNRQFVTGGLRWAGYSYLVPGQWQGRYRTLRVIGDKKAGGTSSHLLAHPGVLDELAAVVRVPVRLIGLTRHPLDNIARLATREQRSVADAADRYFAMARGMARAAEWGDVLWLARESFVSEPAVGLRRIAAHVQLEPDPEWVEASAAVVDRAPALARREVAWDPGLLASVRERAAAFPFLSHYVTAE